MILTPKAGYDPPKAPDFWKRMAAKNIKRLELIQVECYSGYKAHETPRAFIRKGKRYQIVEIRDRWYEGGISRKSIRLDYYKVLAEDGGEYILRYNGLFDKWALLLR